MYIVEAVPAITRVKIIQFYTAISKNYWMKLTIREQISTLWVQKKIVRKSLLSMTANSDGSTSTGSKIYVCVLRKPRETAKPDVGFLSQI